MAPNGSVYVSDLGNDRVRKIDPGGTITTIAESSLSGLAGDGAPADRASLDSPAGLFLDAGGTLYIADSRNRRIRTLSPIGIAGTLVGNLDDERLCSPQDVFVDARGDVYIADGSAHRIFRLRGAATPTRLEGAQLKTADFNEDGRVYFADFLAFAAQFGADNPDDSFDLCKDGRIDFQDFIKFGHAFE